MKSFCCFEFKDILQGDCNCFKRLKRQRH